ncbi:hypothetical protein Syun_004056 [Stephania yunnanensis]|uniref:Uncharacterized protein n=1 Tax=Stephania yunnanensis TaxID=152371 RepID=A0AAP0L6B1_9MAGN
MLGDGNRGMFKISGFSQINLRDYVVPPLFFYDLLLGSLVSLKTTIQFIYLCGKFAMKSMKNEGLLFPILITHLCKQAGFSFDIELYVLLEKTINDVGIQRMKKVVGYNDLEDEKESFYAIKAIEVRM